jgi:ribosome-binding factor A
MTSRRVLKAAEAIREVVSMAILVDLRDPRVSDVTVIRVEVSGDMRTAKVYVSIMGDEKKQMLGLRGLESAAGFLQAKVANRIDTRYTPRLAFVLDQGVKKSLEVNRILREVLPSTNDDAETPEDEASARDSFNPHVDVTADHSPPAVEVRESSL